MPIQDPRHPRPPYDVVAVFDPDGEEPSFAYTTGVYDAYGGPDLFVWSIPDEGVDPGELWVLSLHDQHAELTAAVDRLLDQSRLDVGDSWDRDLDGGRSVMRVTVVEGEDDLPGTPPGCRPRQRSRQTERGRRRPRPPACGVVAGLLRQGRCRPAGGA